MKTYVHLSYLIQLFLEREMFQTKLQIKSPTRILCPIAFSHKSCSLCDNVEKHGMAGKATDDNITRRMPFRVG